MIFNIISLSKEKYYSDNSSSLIGGYSIGTILAFCFSFYYNYKRLKAEETFLGNNYIGIFIRALFAGFFSYLYLIYFFFFIYSKHYFNTLDDKIKSINKQNSTQTYIEYNPQ